MRNILITGGDGFVGSHVAQQLLSRGCRVKVFDNLTPQVHGEDRKRPSYLNADVELILGDVRNPDAVMNALSGIDAVYHFAARVGVGQSMYQIAEYTSVNNLGTAVLLECILRSKGQKLIVASSMSIYGEGMYATENGNPYLRTERTAEQLQAADWEVRAHTGETLTPIPTPETKQPNQNSVYALSKFDQERMCLTIGQTYGVPVVALRFFNIYGPHQALSNPCTGVLAMLAAQLLTHRAPARH